MFPTIIKASLSYRDKMEIRDLSTKHPKDLITTRLPKNKENFHPQTNIKSGTRSGIKA
jgi:hypothetical protein